jgi:hypothetical protein
MRTCPQCRRDYEEQEACPGCGRLEVEAVCERHPGRAARGVCVVCGSAVCDECDADEVREFLCPEHHAVPIIDGWAQVYTTSDDMEAELIRDNLRAEGLEAELLSQKDHFAVPVEFGDLSLVRVLVPAADYTDALIVLARHMDTTGEVSFACPQCGEAYEPGETTCRNCGARLATNTPLGSATPAESAIGRAAEEERHRRAAEGPEIGGGMGGTSDAEGSSDEAAMRRALRDASEGERGRPSP